LRSHGYATFATGKWHMAPMEECSAAGPHHNWPLQKGFDKFYGFLQGETDQFYPELTRDNTHIDPPGGPDDGYHVSEDIVDQSIAYINDLVSVRPDRPFFLYMAFGAMHAPHQSPQSYRDMYRGAFDEGYEVWRDRWFARQQELEHLEREHRALELIADEARAFAARAEAAAAEARNRVGTDREALSQSVRQAASLRLDTERCAQQVQRAQADRSRLDADLAEVTTQQATRENAIAEEVARFESLDLLLADHQEALENCRSAYEDAEAGLSAARDTLRDIERDEREAAFAARSIEARSQSLREQAEQSLQIITQSQTEAAGLQIRLDALSAEAARGGLQQALEQRVRCESALSEVRARLDSLTATMREQDELRLGHERSQQPLRDQLTELQLKEQAARLGADQFAEQLAQAEIDTEALRASFAQTPRPSWLQGEVTRLINAIAALGAVNLAALDELTTSRERKTFLDAQCSDLNEAMATLEDAIRRIDRETRTLLQDTFDSVNRHFGTLFPELFGGGEARLVLTGEEILDSGVSVVAQPPGKRNSSVHLLSGGEKALTAIALVFALFQLNPAPFCLLDEVDAPLDDANTERYCNMVRRMSDQTQFLFITHNKIAMELAQQLVGVTMQERGVSRIVAVDIDAATRFAEAA
jgi:chromosome segregation protein